MLISLKEPSGCKFKWRLSPMLLILIILSIRVKRIACTKSETTKVVLVDVRTVIDILCGLLLCMQKRRTT